MAQDRRKFIAKEIRGENRQVCYAIQNAPIPGERLTRNAPGSATRNRAGRGRSPKRVDCTIATNDEQPEYRVRAHDV